MLDYGTGSGVLAVAALKMGAAGALGIDCEAQATDLCSATAELNGLSSRFEVSLCSEDVEEVGSAPLPSAGFLVLNFFHCCCQRRCTALVTNVCSRGLLAPAAP